MVNEKSILFKNFLNQQFKLIKKLKPQHNSVDRNDTLCTDRNQIIYTSLIYMIRKNQN
jgi:hypothetical protein